MTEITASFAPAPGHDQQLRKATEALEAGFLAEMLKAAGLGTPRGAFGGGSGAEQFTSFLCHAQAEAMVRAGGIGLAEQLFAALTARTSGHNGHDG